MEDTDHLAPKDCPHVPAGKERPQLPALGDVPFLQYPSSCRAIATDHVSCGEIGTVGLHRAPNQSLFHRNLVEDRPHQLAV